MSVVGQPLAASMTMKVEKVGEGSCMVKMVMGTGMVVVDGE